MSEPTRKDIQELAALRYTVPGDDIVPEGRFRIGTFAARAILEQYVLIPRESAS